MGANRLEIREVTLGFKDGPSLIEHFSLTVEGGQLIGLLGRNGVGKSTLLKALAGVRPPLNGDILYGEGAQQKEMYNMTAAERAKEVAFVMTETFSVAHLRVREVVSMGRAPYTGWFGNLSDEDKRVVDEALAWVGMSDFAEKAVDTLSDGERQRVMIARALAQDTPVMLLDEPTAFLDLPNRYQIVLLLKRLAHRTGKIILFSSHDLSVAVQLCDTLWVMSNADLTAKDVRKGSVVAGNPQELMRSGALDVIFAGTALRLVSADGTVRLEEEPDR